MLGKKEIIFTRTETFADLSSLKSSPGEKERKKWRGNLRSVQMLPKLKNKQTNKTIILMEQF